MPGYLTAAAKATSTFCLLWSAYLLARSRAHRKKPLTSSSGHDDSSVVELNDSDQLKAFSLELEDPIASFSYPTGISDHTRSDDSDAGMRSLLHQSWSALTGFLRRRFTDDSHSSQLIPFNASLSLDKLSFYLSHVIELAEKAKLSPDVLVYSKKVHQLRTNQPPEVLIKTLLEALVAYTKNDDFVSVLLGDSDFPHFLHFLVHLALTSYHPTSQSRESTLNKVVTMLEPPQLAQNEWPSWKRKAAPTAQHTPRPQSERTPLCDMLQTTESHPEYPIHLLVANILANASRNMNDNHVLFTDEVETLLDTWCNSPSLHLLLLGAKIRFNLGASQNPDCQSQLHHTCEEDTFKPIYYPDIFRLDKPDSSTDPLKTDYDFDVVFVHGMRGSVFYTWRQSEVPSEVSETSEMSPSKCWPRDWLSSEFPRARVLGIDTSLSPFIWNPICPIDRLQRTLDTRAKALLPQLKAAGVGRRPVIWVTHSAGGILVKELLRLSKCGDANRSETGTPISAHSALGARYTPSTVEQFDNFIGNSAVMGSPVNSDVETEERLDARPHPMWFCDPADASSPNGTRPLSHRSYDCTSFIDMSSQAKATPSLSSQHRSNTLSKGMGFVESGTVTATLDAVSRNSLADSTRGVVFMSAPHRGNQSLFALYRWPLRLTLTPEAIQLERNSDYLLDLHSWFNLWALRDKVRVLSMVEQRVTPVNRFWSVLLVPEDKRDREMGEVVHIDSDHMYISKPRCPSDPTYVHIVNFIRQTVPELGIDVNYTTVKHQSGTSADEINYLLAI